MSMWDALWPFGEKHRQRVAEAKEADTNLQSAFQEAMLRQGDLKDAAADMKRAREEFKRSREEGRDALPSSS